MTAGNARPIVIRKVKKVVGGHHGGAWKVAYADFVTAMMAFFMLLWLISSPDKQRLKGLAEYFTPNSPSAGATGQGTMQSGGVGASGARTSRSPASAGQPTADLGKNGAKRAGTAEIASASQKVMAQEMQVALEKSAGETGTQAGIKIDADRDGARISLMDTAQHAMFREGTAELTPWARTLLSAVAGKLRKIEAQIAIEGHTDGTGGQTAANWQLSAARALAARQALIDAGMTVDRFGEVVALAATQPVYPDQPDRPENRRITIVVLGASPSLPADPSFAF